METEDNIVEFTGEYESAMQELLGTIDEDRLGQIIAGVLEFLTVRAIIDGPFYLMTDDKQAITVIAAHDDATNLYDALPDNFKSWDEYTDEEVNFVSNRDIGDEQPEESEHEPTA
jgi:hypothetical protein